MASLKLYPTFVLLATLLYSVYGKGSLTLVVDDNFSMLPQLLKINDQVDSIFNLLERVGEVPYENFILCTFSDTGAQLRTVTTDRKVFKTALDAIVESHSQSGPKFALTGIKLAIENSRPNSTLCVFTDASAKDYMMYDEVAAMVNQKNVQINFVLAGDCGRNNDIATNVYNRLGKVQCVSDNDKINAELATNKTRLETTVGQSV